MIDRIVVALFRALVVAICTSALGLFMLNAWLERKPAA
jgi:hypothetical protein